MTTEHFYRSQAASFLYACIASSLIVAIFIAGSLALPIRPPIALITLPFLIYCFFQYQAYMKYLNISRQTRPVNHIDSPILLQNELLIGFLPAPALRMMLFEPGGRLAGEIKEMDPAKWRWLIPVFIDRYFKKTFLIYDQNKQLVGKIIISKKHGTSIYDIDTVLIAHLKNSGKVRRNSVKIMDGSTLEVNGSMLFTDTKYISQKGEIAGRLRRGWMPLKWENNFPDPNTPVIVFHPTATMRERLTIIGSITTDFLYYDH
ncbi:hypothetical protein [Mesobacillus harenae]|uniref:hypothetical protein n=1 Tax=Mesobacillus harenae TaxID=2213203 RepID=UPI00157FE204|nr:hypothetical protein [Mesobacillus harenae]